MRIVIDTNVLVSALHKPSSVPDRLLDEIFGRSSSAGPVAVLYDVRVGDEYRSVLARPKFHAIARDRIEGLLETFFSRGVELRDVPAWRGALPDEGDRIFVELALAGDVDAIVTGNIKHYPLDLGFQVLPPASLLATLGARGPDDVIVE